MCLVGQSLVLIIRELVGRERQEPRMTLMFFALISVEADWADSSKTYLKIRRWSNSKTAVHILNSTLVS